MKYVVTLTILFTCYNESFSDGSGKLLKRKHMTRLFYRKKGVLIGQPDKPT